MMQQINKKPFIKRKIDEFISAFPEYGYWDIVFTALRFHFQGEDICKSDLFKLTDDDFYSALCKAFDKEVRIESRLKDKNIED